MVLKKIKEGEVEIFVPSLKKIVRRRDKVFYNPEMELSRDVSVSVLQVFSRKHKINACDCLSATGIRGLRYAKEVSNVESVMLNDKNPSAFKIIKKNIKHNKLEKICSASNDDASILLRSNVYNFIDIDPFGSPNIFLDSGARSVWHKGLLAITATDTAPLSGTYPRTCMKKYGISSIKTPFYSELGLRILLSYIILTLSRYEKAYVPVLSYASRHYFRTFGRIEHQGKIKQLLDDFGYVTFCEKCGRQNYGELELKCMCGKRQKFCGPIYLGKIQDKNFVKEVLKDLSKREFKLREKEVKLLDCIANEIDTPFYYDLHFLSKKKLITLEKTDKVISDLRMQGYIASRTHFSPTAIKTNKKF